MNRDEISWVRQMLREYYDAVLSREEELKEEMPIYSTVKVPSLFFGEAHIRFFGGYEFRAPISIRDEINHIKRELKYWSVVNESIKDEV